MLQVVTTAKVSGSVVANNQHGSLKSHMHLLINQLPIGLQQLDCVTNLDGREQLDLVVPVMCHSRYVGNDNTGSLIL